MSNSASSLSVPHSEEEHLTSEATPKLRRRNRLAAWVFVVPALIFQITWGWYPLIFAFLISFTNAEPLLPARFTGLESYIRMVNDPLTFQAFRVTFLYAGISIVLTFMIPIIVAILLMEMPQRSMRLMMLLWFLPLSPIANAVLWKYVYNTQYGLLKFIVTDVFHLPTQQFLNDPNQVLFWLILPGILLFGPGLLYMASLQSIPTSYYEAAEVEGASLLRKIWSISLPRLRPVIAMMLTFAIINSLQEFAWPQIMTNGMPEGSSRTVVMYMYSIMSGLRFADATALSIMLFLVILAIVLLYRTFVKEDPDA